MRYRYAIVGGLAIAAVIGWSVYWNAMRNEATAWPEAAAEQLRDAGWDASIGAAVGDGYPSRLRVTLNDVALGAPSGDWAWSAPTISAASLIYRRDHTIIDWPDTQRLTTPFGAMSVASNNMRASLSFGDADGAPLVRLSWDAPTTSIVAPGLGLYAARAQVHLRRPPDAAADVGRYQLAVAIDDLSARPVAAAERAPAVERLEALGTAVFAAPVTHSPPHAPRLERIEIEAANSLWSGAEVAFSGELTQGEAGWRLDLTLNLTRASLTLERLITLGAMTTAEAATLLADVDEEDMLSGRLIWDAAGLRFRDVALLRP